MNSPFRTLLTLCMTFWGSTSAVNAQVVINEIVASNGTTLEDEDGDQSDWIEIYNELPESLSLNGFALTDDPDNLTKWLFPAVTIPGKGYLVVFASGKDRRLTDGSPLHTNFKLSGDGEYLALVKPDGESLNSVFSPAYPPQRVDIAYGTGRQSELLTAITEGADCRWHVPASATEITDWNTIAFDDTSWNSGQTGIGFDYPEHIGEGSDTREAMVGKNASVFLRVPFTVDKPGSVVDVALRMKFEDGFIAYLNGREIVRFNSPSEPAWNSTATDSHSDSQAVNAMNFNVNFAGVLVEGQNVLAIQGMNVSVGGSDLLVLPELDITVHTGDATTGFLNLPTPGKPNGTTIPSLLDPPTFSVTRGHFSEPFELTLSTPDTGVRIYYSVDGDAPDSLYQGPISINETTVIRALTQRAGTAPDSSIATHTYLFVDDIVDQSALHTTLTKRISESEEYGPLLKESLLALPSVCISMDGRQPTAREDAVSIELIDPKGEEPGFQVDAGTKVVGGHSVSSPKNNFRVYFRSEYGTSSLKYPLFEGHPYSSGATDEFSRLMLRSGSHDTFFWLGNTSTPPSGGRKSDATYLRNRWINDMGMIMGNEALHGRFVQLFINGSYHGHYQIMEFPNDDFHASYLGGAKEDYHFTNGANRDKTGSDHGNGDTWWANWAELKSRARGDDYAAAADVIDLENLVDYMLLSYYSGNTWDWNPNQNWMAGGPKAPGSGGWKFYSWDCDIIFQDVSGNNLSKNVPDGLFADLIRNHEEFRVLVRDRIYKHLFNDGALTPQRVRSVFDYRANEIFTSIVAETARWQASSPASRPWDRDGEWMNEWNHYKEVYFPERTGILLDQLRNTRVGGQVLYPIDAPEFSQRGGTVASGFKPTFLADNGTIYFTTDGSDPRLAGGDVNPIAQTSAGGLVAATFVEKLSEWKYLDDGSDQGTDWRNTVYDDSAWASGQGQLGYGDGDENTVVSFGDDPGMKHVTTYFRRTFSIPSAAAVSELNVSLLRDDGAAVYVNGSEVVRDELPAGNVTYDTLATSSAGGSRESLYYDFTIPTDVLVDGENVIAVEVHQSSTAGSDASFDLQLNGRVASTGSDVTITRDTLIRMRAFDGENWSALNEAFFTLEGSTLASSDNITISEIQYHPSGDQPLEFIEIRNTSDADVNLTGAAFTDGVSFTFPVSTILLAHSSLVVVENDAAFRSVYLDPTLPWFVDEIDIAGQYTGALRNSGETIALVDREGQDIVRFAYDDQGAWPGRADGSGSSLELTDFEADLNEASSWRPSSEYLGSPGYDGSGPDNRVVINEVVASPLEDAMDAIELLNTTGSPIDLSGWFLTDTNSDYKKHALPEGTALAANAILVLTADQFGFGLSGTRGDDITLMESDANGNLISFVDRVEFPAAAPGESFGRWPDGTGNLYPMLKTTLSTANHSNDNTVRIGPVIISEIHYNPDGADDGLEYIVIRNPGTSTQDLSNWKLRGEVDYDFAPGSQLSAGSSITLLGFDPTNVSMLETFRLTYSSSPALGFTGPWNTGTTPGGKLNDGGGNVRLLRPGALIEEPDAEPYTPYYIEDSVEWNDGADWPIAADGGGMALHRVMPTDRGDLAQSWYAGMPFEASDPSAPLPGYEEWALAVFPLNQPPSDILPGADPDGDRISNSAEFAFATNPLAYDGTAMIPIVKTVSGLLQITFRVRETGALRYRLDRSTNLIDWSAVSEADMETVSTTPTGDGIAAFRLIQLRATPDPIVYFRVTATP